MANAGGLRLFYTLDEVCYYETQGTLLMKTRRLNRRIYGLNHRTFISVQLFDLYACLRNMKKKVTQTIFLRMFAALHAWAN